MSTEIATLNDVGSKGEHLTITRYAGGKEKGVCYQLTQLMGNGNHGYVQFSLLELDIIYSIIKNTKDARLEDPLREFYVTIAANQSLGSGYFKVHASTEAECKTKIERLLGYQYSMIYSDFTEVHPVDRKLHGIIF